MKSHVLLVLSSLYLIEALLTMKVNDKNKSLLKLTILSIIAITLSFIVLLGSLIFWIKYAKNDALLKSNHVMDMSVKTTEGIQEEILLGDNSKIWINSNSTLKYASDYKIDRKLQLEGEAYFKIKEKENLFTLSTPQAVIYLQKAVFLAEAYEDKAYTRFSLFDGEVKLVVNETSQEVHLHPGTHLVIHKETNQLEINRLKTGVYGPAWIVNKFDYTAFNNVLYSLADYYDISLTNQRPDLNIEPYTLTFEGDRTLDEAMRIMQAVSREFLYRIEGKELLIY